MGARRGKQVHSVGRLVSLTRICSCYSIHANLTDPHLLTSAVYAVLQDVIKVDISNGKKQREVFLNGA